MSALTRGKLRTADGRIVEITDQEFQCGRWWPKKIDQFNREIYLFRNPIPVEKGGETTGVFQKLHNSSPLPGRGPLLNGL